MRNALFALTLLALSAAALVACGGGAANTHDETRSRANAAFDELDGGSPPAPR